MGSFQDLLNRLRGNDIPSQMPGAMGGGFDHGITGNLSDIQIRPIDYGVKGGSTPALDADGRPIPGTSTGIYQMPYTYGDQGGIQQMPYTGGVPSLIDFGKGIEALKKGKERGGVMNDSTYEALQMLQGY